MKHWNVISPEVSEKIDIGLDDGTGPLEYFRCAVSVEANTKAEAKRLAVKHPGTQVWVDKARSDGVNPFVGLEVDDPVCKHGVCWCDICQGWCDLCVSEMEREEAEAAEQNAREADGG